MENGSYFWLIKPEYYNKMNDLIGTNFDNFSLNYFRTKCKKGIYAAVILRYSNIYCSYMKYPYYYKNGKHSSKKYLEISYKYMGEISRKSKLKKLKKLKNLSNEL